MNHASASCPAGSLQTDHGASIAACAQQDRYPLVYALIQSGADVCAAIEAVLTEANVRPSLLRKSATITKEQMDDWIARGRPVNKPAGMA